MGSQTLISAQDGSPAAQSTDGGSQHRKSILSEQSTA